MASEPTASLSRQSDVRAIWRFVVDSQNTRVKMPQGARILHVHEQTGNVCVWTEVDPEAPIVERVLLVLGDGDKLSPGVRAATYVGTAHLVDAGATLFVYDGGEIPNVE